MVVPNVPGGVAQSEGTTQLIFTGQQVFQAGGVNSPVNYSRALWIYNRTVQSIYVTLAFAGSQQSLPVIVPPRTDKALTFGAPVSNVNVQYLSAIPLIGDPAIQTAIPPTDFVLIAGTSDPAMTVQTPADNTPQSRWYSAFWNTIAAGATVNDWLSTNTQITPRILTGFEIYNLSSGATAPSLNFSWRLSPSFDHSITPSMIGGYCDTATSQVQLLPGMAESTDINPPIYGSIILAVNNPSGAIGTAQLKLRGWR